ncbi:PqiC family protein [Pseudoxanthobacter sp.]|uniref:PqiC family protein n=1 Tax=Pseudoxanthobacter sp. TaxID=1925742 RepID=UPI002FDF14A4
MRPHRTRRLLRHAVAGLLLGAAAPGLVACASPDPVLYTLSPVDGAPRSGGPARVEVREIGLARYLDRPQIVLSTADSRVDIAANQRWGDPFGAMFSRVLAENLSQRLPGSLVYNDTGTLSVTPNAVVEVSLQRLDRDRDGSILMVAQVAVMRGGSTAARAVRLSVPPAGSSTQDNVRAMSKATGELADIIAAMLA